MCDTNVLVSGVMFGGHPRRILSRIARGIVANITSPDLLREVGIVLARRKFGLQPDEVFRILALFRDTFEIVEPARRVRVIVADPSDNIVLEAAATGAADAIVSGDKHLCQLHTWNGIPILTPVQFIGDSVGPRDFEGDA